MEPEPKARNDIIQLMTFNEVDTRAEVNILFLG